MGNLEFLIYCLPTCHPQKSAAPHYLLSRNADAKKMNFRVTDQLGRIVNEQKGIVDQVFTSQLSGHGIFTIHLHIPETGEQLIKRVLVQK